MPTTKRLPVAVQLSSGKTRRNDFLVPWLSSAGEPRFLGLRSGKPTRHGLLVYTGVPVTTEDLLERAATGRAAVVDSAGGHLDWYVEALQSFRIGNVLELCRSPDGGLYLSKVADRPPSLGPKPRLPG